MGDFIVRKLSNTVYWECKINGHDKFWAAKITQEALTVSGSGNIIKYILTRKWGAIGTNGQMMEQEFDDEFEANSALSKLIQEKERKGYKPVF